MLCIQVPGVSMPTRVSVAEGRKHIGDMSPLKNEHAQLALQPRDLVVLTYCGIARHLRLELGGLLFQVHDLRMKVAAKILGLN